MKAARVESTRRTLVRPAARAVVIPLNTKSGSARKGAPAAAIVGASVNLDAAAFCIGHRITSTLRNSVPRRWSAGVLVSVSTCVNSANSTRSGSAWTRKYFGSGTVGTASSTASESQSSSGTRSSKSRAVNATCATSRCLARCISTTTMHAALENGPAGLAFAGSHARNATKGSASSAMIRSVCAGPPTISKRQIGGCVRNRRSRQ